MEQDFTHLSLDEEEDTPIPLLVRISKEQPKPNYEFCMVGMFLTYNSINVQSMKSMMAHLRHPSGGVSMVALEAKDSCFVFITSLILNGWWMEARG